MISVLVYDLALYKCQTVVERVIYLTVLWHCRLAVWKDIRPVKISHHQSSQVPLWKTYGRP